MDYITIETLRKMKASGFSYPEYEHFLNYGMLYYYHHDEYFIGGYSAGEFSDLDREVAQNGEWLPEATQLLEWLAINDFTVNITIDDSKYFIVQATGIVDSSLFDGAAPDLSNALAATITKICKSKCHPDIPTS